MPGVAKSNVAASAAQQQLRILHVISSVNPTTGGPIEAVRQLSLLHMQQGHTVEVACLDDPRAPWVASCPLTCHALGPTTAGVYAYTPRLTPWMKAHAKTYDAVILHGIWQYHGFGSWRALRDMGVPYHVYPHGMLDPWFKRQYPLKHLKKWLFWPWGDYRVLRDARAVLFTCEDERILARQSFWLYRCQEQVLSFGTNPPPDDAPAQRDAFLTRFPALSATRNLLFLGRVHEKKGADLLLQAIAALRRAAPERLAHVRLVMAGPTDHPYGQRMKALSHQLGLDDLVVWTGMLQGAEKWGAFRAADAFVLPSHQENFGIAVAEALACEVPVLISRQVNIWREIEAEGAGYMEADTLAGTSALLQRWLDAPKEEWQPMKQAARRCFERHFLMSRSADELIDTLRRG
jgi:glycosyltransferase involved in cell wall biosynthesis